MAGVTGSEHAGSVRASMSSGALLISCEERTDIDVDGQGTAAVEGSVLTIDGGSSRLRVRVPSGTDLLLGSTSGSITIEGRSGLVAVVSTSGRVSVEHAGEIDVRSESGRVTVGRVDGDCCLRSGSGRLEVHSCGAVDVMTDSGRVSIDDARGPVAAHCVSGHIEVELTEPNDVDAETVTGRIDVVVPCVDGATDRVSVRTTSGSVHVTER